MDGWMDGWMDGLPLGFNIAQLCISLGLILLSDPCDNVHCEMRGLEANINKIILQCQHVLI